jgi:hypothetical protein
MNALSKIDRDALLDAAWSFVCFGVNKTLCQQKGWDFYHRMWIQYVAHADHSAQWKGWDGGHWGHIERRPFFILNDETGNIFDAHEDVFVPDISETEFTEVVKAMESGNLTLFNWLSNNFVFFPSASDNTPWARAFA